MNSIFLLFYNENICGGYSLEAPLQGTSNAFTINIFNEEMRKKKYSSNMYLNWNDGLQVYVSHRRVNIMNLIFFLFLQENICCGYSSEVPLQCDSNDLHNKCFH